MNVELKEDITFNEFQAWMVGLIRGKKGALPDLDDWRKIKMMMDKVVPDKEVITLPSPQPFNPEPFNPEPFIPYRPYIGDPTPNPWVTTSDNTGDIKWNNGTTNNLTLTGLENVGELTTTISNVTEPVEFDMDTLLNAIEVLQHSMGEDDATS